MKVTIEENPVIAETEVTVRCASAASAEARRVISVLREADLRITGRKDGRTVLVNAADTLYFDTVDKRTFIYTEADTFETQLRLYMLEERLSDGSFIRISKNAIVNLNKVVSLTPQFGGRVEAKLRNGERLMVSRQYVPALKTKLKTGGL